MNAIIKDAEVRNLAARATPFTLNEDPPRQRGRTVFQLYDMGEPVQQTLDLTQLIATQRAFDAEHVHKLMKKPKSLAVEPIECVRLGGKLFITNGHHRATAAAFNGDKTIRANVVFAK